MEQYHSDLLNSLFENDERVNANMEVLNVKENLLGGSSIVDRNGNPVLETMPNAAGGETVMFENGETANLTDNIYNGSTLDFTGVSNDITTRPAIFGEEQVYQGSDHIGTLEPNLMGDGYDFTSTANDTLFSTSTNSFGDTQISFDSSFFEAAPGSSAMDLHHSFSEIDTVSSQFSAADLGSATDAVDGIDVLGLL
ncbi:hypothetical protein GWK91_10120 [Virgibacillus sp. MSP4-1]|uniref:hypothetical protein n=1 Tax=Virgibacillus sp. MSP4-1 TaxID=2700081 RepID=UPI00039A009A|nr:hypothetical protein [Virgibacillus sp. MSP4-1]QHS23282.1 hypothetical protein GWK91_10120 [Virgibacillus sp. MSP4-1]